MTLFLSSRWTMLRSYRCFFVVILMAAAVSGGCRRTEQKTEQEYDGPTVNAFTGRLTRKGEPVSFPKGQKVVLQLKFEKGSGPLGIPIQSDGTFNIKWMAIGKYSMTLVRGRNMYAIPGTLTIEEGKTAYTIELEEEGLGPQGEDGGPGLAEVGEGVGDFAGPVIQAARTLLLTVAACLA